MSGGRDQAGVALLSSGSALVFGGSNEGGQLWSAESYDRTSKRWTQANPLQGYGTSPSFYARNAAVVLPSGKVLVALPGFFDVYDPTTHSWYLTGLLSQAGAYDHAVAVLPSGKVIVAGGGTAAAEIYEVGKDPWPIGAMNTVRSNHTATTLPSGKVLVAGGWNNVDGQVATAELYDPVTERWTRTASMLSRRTMHTATLLPSGKVLVVGGGDPSFEELYDPTTETWTATWSMAEPRDSHTATLLPSGRVLVAGGADIDYVPLASAELYDPATGLWSRTGSMATARMEHTAVLLPTGEVLIAGGTDGIIVLQSAELYQP